MAKETTIFNKVLFGVASGMFVLIMASGAFVYETIDEDIQYNKIEISQVKEHLKKIDSTLLVGQLLDSVSTANIMDKLDEIQDIIK